MGTAMQRMFLARLDVENMNGAIERKPAIGDAIGETPRHRAEARRMSLVIWQRIEPENDVLRPLRRRHDEIAQDSAPGKDFCDGARIGGDRHFDDRHAVNLAEPANVHQYPLPDHCAEGTMWQASGRVKAFAKCRRWRAARRGVRVRLPRTI